MAAVVNAVHVLLARPADLNSSVQQEAEAVLVEVLVVLEEVASGVSETLSVKSAAVSFVANQMIVRRDKLAVTHSEQGLVLASTAHCARVETV